jgi:uncharacterized Ntn-hydrolase superfamily protein
VTYSIVARDPDTGEMGVATQSQAFAVGGSVPFALPGHGVIATQSMAEPMYGSIGLDLLQGGFTAQEVLTALSSVDPQRFGKARLMPADVIERIAPAAI